MRKLPSLVATSFILLNFTPMTVLADNHQSNHIKAAAAGIERGRYMIKMAGCNDCHTDGYTQNAGKIPEENWLKGSNVGWKGAWGTTYASNLRLVLNQMSEAKWLKIARTVQYRPPMPWFSLHDMKEDDLRAIYRFVKYLGPAGEAVPSFLPPDKTTPPPYVLFP